MEGYPPPGIWSKMKKKKLLRTGELLVQLLCLCPSIFTIIIMMVSYSHISRAVGITRMLWHPFPLCSAVGCPSYATPDIHLHPLQCIKCICPVQGLITPQARHPGFQLLNIDEYDIIRVIFELNIKGDG